MKTLFFFLSEKNLKVITTAKLPICYGDAHWSYLEKILLSELVASPVGVRIRDARAKIAKITSKV
jgi:hypothetical protein